MALQAEISGLRTQIEESHAEKASLISKWEDHNRKYAELVAENAQLQERENNLQQIWAQEKAAMEVRLEEAQAFSQGLQRRKEDAEKNRDLFRELYDQASAHASEVKGENTELRRRTSIAEGQTHDGIGMLKATYTQQVKRLQEEVERWKGLCKVLTTKDERTNDEVRRRAALEPVLREENEKLKGHLDALQADFQTAKTILQQLNCKPEPNDGTNEDEDEVSDHLLHSDSPVDPVDIDQPSIECQITKNIPPVDDSYSNNCHNAICQHTSDTSICHTKFLTFGVSLFETFRQV